MSVRHLYLQVLTDDAFEAQCLILTVGRKLLTGFVAVLQLPSTLFQMLVWPFKSRDLY